MSILGYLPCAAPRNIRVKVNRSIRRLEEIGVLEKGGGNLVSKHQGVYSVKLHRGRDFFKVSDSQPKMTSPLVDPLKSIGFDNRAIRGLLAKFSLRLLNEWVDITLAAVERFGSSYFRKSPAAYLVDNLNHAAKGVRTPPDWWHEIRKAEQKARAKIAREKRLGKEPCESSSMPENAIASLEDIQSTIFDHFLSDGQSESVAKLNSKRFRDAAQKRKRSR